MEPTWRIERVEDQATLEVVRRLLKEYWQSFGFTPCFQNFSEELAGLPGDYAPPGGRQALARVGQEPAGCFALRPADAGRAEAKRLYVRPEFRRLGLGRALMDWVIAEARSAGYHELVGDSMPAMRDAIALYGRMGFERVEGGAPQTAPDAIFIRLKL